MEAESVFVTGANRGIGLEFVKQLVCLPKPPKHVFATYRNKDSLKFLEEIRDSSQTSQVVLIQMDVTRPDDLQAARKTVEDVVEGKGLNLLINNAGANRFAYFSDVTEDNMDFHFSTNTTGPLMVFKELFPLLQTAACSKEGCMNVSRAAVLNISSTKGSCGSLDGTHPREWLAALGYRASKSALNMAMRVVALTVKEQGILVVQMCPGWVKTDMGTEQAQITTEESISCMLNTLPKLNESNHGDLVDRNGETIPF